MWSLESYECLRIFLNEDAIFLSVACTHDGVLTGSSDGIVRFWEVDTAETPVGKGALSPQSQKQVGSQGRKASNLSTLGCTQMQCVLCVLLSSIQQVHLCILRASFK